MSSTSSSFRTELNIPVKKDPRTFEQSRKDLVTNLEKSYKTSSSVDPTGDSVSSISSQSVKSSTRSTGAGPLAGGWEFQRSRWIDEAKKQFDEDVRRMRNSMFALEVSHYISTSLNFRIYRLNFKTFPSLFHFNVEA